MQRGTEESFQREKTFELVFEAQEQTKVDLKEEPWRQGESVQKHRGVRSEVRIEEDTSPHGRSL